VVLYVFGVGKTIMMNIKLPAVAGKFYPADPSDLRKMLQHLLAGSGLDNIPQPKIILAPHAGYIFSGPIAANAYRILSKMPHIKHVVLIGPSHYVYVEGAALPSAQSFRTPLGDIPVNQEFIDKLQNLPHINIFDEAFAQEHSLEVQLPFLQVQLNNFTITPILVGHPDKTLVAKIIEQFWDREDTLFVISSDLSHYHEYKTAVQHDQQTMGAILNLDADTLAPEQACGCFAIKGLLHFAKQHNFHAQLLDMRNSGDTQGDKNRVVGYSAVHFYKPISVIEHLKSGEESILINLAHESIKYGLKNNQPGHVVLNKLPPIFHYRCASFVTLNKNKELRGCIGSLEVKFPVAEDVVRNAYASAFQDPRFRPLQERELSEIRIEISLLSPLMLIDFKTEEDLILQLRPGIDGVLISENQYRGVFLPLVWEKIPDRMLFWQALKQKAHMPLNYWSNNVRAWRFTTRVIEQV
jgi:AmmeMemoRadiSam system protein B/AmmeMemoRadiSam system protein A